MKKCDYLIVGCGLSGAVLSERIASVLNKKVLIIDKKNHIAGNSFDYQDKHGIMVHQYGPHIFHTNYKNVWDYLSQFTSWFYYFHRVNAFIDGTEVPLPFNFNSINKVFPTSLAARLESKLSDLFEYNKKIPILELKKYEDEDLNFLANYIYDKVFLGYTTKQWGVRPEDLDESVTARVPVYLSRDNRYFQDKYQGIPENGYTYMVKKMLDNKNIEVLLSTDFKDIKDSIEYKKLIFTGPIDEFFDYKYGELPYRSLKFDFKELDQEYYLNSTSLNFPENYDFTRITEFKRFTNVKSEKTSIVIEYPQEYVISENEPYYPIPDAKNNEIYARYLKESEKLANTIFIGRLAEYKYYNMDQIVYNALKVFDTLC